VTDGVRQVRLAHTGTNLTRFTDARGKLATYTYDPANTNNPGLMTARTLPEGNTPMRQLYRPDGRVASQSDAAGGTMRFAYARVDGTNLTTTTDALGQTMVHVYQPDGELTSLTDEAGLTLHVFSDAAGRCRQILDRNGVFSGPMLYDETNGLPVANIGVMDSGGPAGTRNRVGRQAADPPGPHALTRISNPQSQIPNRTYPYDANGNMTDIDGLQCTWDFKDRLVAVENDKMRAEYTYDYTDRRISKRVHEKSPLPTQGGEGQGEGARPSLTTLYINKYFKVREHEQPTSWLRNTKSLFSAAIINKPNFRIEVPKFKTPDGQYGEREVYWFETVDFEKMGSMKFQAPAGIAYEDLVMKARKELRAASPEAYELFLLCMCAGLRRGEADVCLWSQLRPDDCSIRVEATEFIEPKHGSGGIVYVDPALMKELLSFRASGDEGFIVQSHLEWKVTAYVRYRCEPHWRTLLDWLETNGLSARKKVHELRKLFGDAIVKREGIFAGSAQLRHSTIQMTANHYTDPRQRAALPVGRLFSDKPPRRGFKARRTSQSHEGNGNGNGTVRGANTGSGRVKKLTFGRKQSQ
jgi:YD repeat-containing protein